MRFETVMSRMGWGVFFLLVSPAFLIVLATFLDWFIPPIYRTWPNARCDMLIHRCAPYELPYMATVWLGHPRAFGALQAIGDIERGRPKWFMFGLMYEPAFREEKRKLASQGVELRAGGCVIGGPDYVASMAYNRVVAARYPELFR